MYEIPPKQIKAIRTLDVEWAHEFMERTTGSPFLPGPSEVTGAMFSADQNALIALHKMRTRVGSKKERRASIEWLKSRGLNGLFEEKLDTN